MSEFYGGPVEFTFNADLKDEDTGAGKWNWAATVFNDPLALPPRLQTKWTTHLDETYESSLYSDWQTRNTILGYHMLESRAAQLKLAIYSYRNGLVKRQRAVSLSRTRLSAIEKINQAEPNKDLKYPPEVIAEMQREVADATEEYEYLRGYATRIASLSTIIERLGDTVEGGDQSLPEEVFRLIGMGWKGQNKVKAFRSRFPNIKYHLNQSSDLPLRYTLTGNDSNPGLDIMLDEDVAVYLLHCLETIAELSADSAPLFDPSTRKNYTATSWPPALMMLRAIVELFYFCSFELPYSNPTIYVDCDDPDKLLVYQDSTGKWQSITEESPGNRLKRKAAEIVSLLVSPPPFLNCVEPEELSRYCRPSLVEGKGRVANPYQPYWSIGLASLYSDLRSHIYKFHSGYEFCVQLIEQLIRTQPHLMRAFQGEDGPISKLLALARFEPGAFKEHLNPGKDGSFPDSERFALLGRFWRLLGKQRPLALLGYDYAKAIYRGIEASGEAPPERSSMLSVHLSSVFAQSALGKTGALTDPLTALMLGDQIRLMELLNESWAFTADCISRLQQADNTDSLSRLFSNSILSPEHEPKLAVNFNNKWVNATQPIWSLIRAVAPVGWDFWIRMVNKIPVQTVLAGFNTEGALNYLFQYSADLVRLILLVETCNPVLAERMSIDGETAGREMLAAFSPYRRYPMIAASLNYYFDLSIEHDRWLGFTVNFKAHLEQFYSSLQNVEGAKAQTDLVRSAITQLEAQYPELAARSKVTIQPEIRPQSSSRVALSSPTHSAIDENSARNIEKLCQGYLGPHLYSPAILPELVALAGITELAGDIEMLSKLSEPLRGIIIDRLKLLVFSSPSAIRDVSNFLRLSWPDGKATSMDDRVRSELTEYLMRTEQLNKYLRSILGESPFFEGSAQVRLTKATFSDNEVIENYFLYSINGRTLCSLEPVLEALPVADKVRKYVTECIGESLPNWQPEILFLGGGKIRCGRGQVTFAGSAQLNPRFSMPSGQSSSRLLWYSLKVRFERALQIFRDQLPGVDFNIEI